MTHTTSPRPTATITADELMTGDTITAGFGVYSTRFVTDRRIQITWTHREVNGDNRAMTEVLDTTPFEVFIG